MASVLTICSLCVSQNVSVVCQWTSLSPTSAASSWCYAHGLFPYSSPRDPPYVMGALRIHFKHFQLRILSLYKQSRYFLQHNHDALRLFISLRFHDFFLRQYFTSVAWTPIAHGSDVIHLASTGRRCSRFFGNETAYDNVICGSDISGLSYSVFRLLGYHNQRFRLSTRFLGAVVVLGYLLA